MELLNIGYISKAHGLKGHVILKSSCQFSKTINALFIELNGSQAPFFIHEMKPFNGDYLLKLDSVNSIDQASKFKNCAVLAEKKHIIKEETFEFLNFILIDVLKGEIGKIEELVNNPGNPLLRIVKDDKEILLPYNSDFIQKVDSDLKQIVYRAPEGLLDMYL